MELDQWLEKVKGGNHLLEDELKQLCEYVSFSSSSFSSSSSSVMCLTLSWIQNILSRAQVFSLWVTSASSESFYLEIRSKVLFQEFLTWFFN
jgi:hypothetical protein